MAQGFATLLAVMRERRVRSYERGGLELPQYLHAEGGMSQSFRSDDHEVVVCLNAKQFSLGYRCRQIARSVWRRIGMSGVAGGAGLMQILPSHGVNSLCLTLILLR
jgi:hypothetical protein